MKSKLVTSFLAILLAASSAAIADSKKEARVTQIIRDVKLMPSEAAAHAATMNDKVNEDTGVRTGTESRSELTFVDLTITRLGANTVFAFTKGGHNTEMESGSMLLRVPKNSGGGRITSSGVSVAVTGTTVILESLRGNRLFVLEGGARISLIKYPSQFQILRAGQMVDVPPGAKTILPPTNFDINDLMRKHPLITDFPPLPSRDLIVAASPQQTPRSGPLLPFVPVGYPIGGGLTSAPPMGPGGNQPGGQTRPPPTGGGATSQPPTGGGTTQPPPSSGGRTHLPPGAGQATNTGPAKAPPTSTPPPIIYRQPGQTVGQPAKGTTATGPRRTPPPRRTIRQPIQTTNQGPR